MKAIWNNIRAVDLLETLGYVDARQHRRRSAIRSAGTTPCSPPPSSRGSSAVVTSCGFTAFHDYYKGNLKGWTSDRYMPRIRDVYGSNPDKMPFDFPEVLAAIAPAASIVAAPLHDGNFDNPGVRKVIAAPAGV